MIIKTLQTTKGKIKVRIPDSLHEITIGQMIEMEKLSPGDASIPLAPDLTQEICDNITDYNQLLQLQERVLSLAHKIKYCYNENAIPKTILINGRKIKVMSNLSIEPAGAYLASRDLIADEINKHIAQYGEDNWKDNFSPSIDICAGLLAHYFYCHATGNSYSEQKAEAFKEEILKLSVQDALPIARYFFLKFPDLSKQKISLWAAIKQNWKRKQALHRLKNLNTSTS